MAGNLTHPDHDPTYDYFASEEDEATDEDEDLLQLDEDEDEYGYQEDDDDDRFDEGDSDDLDYTH